MQQIRVRRALNLLGLAAAVSLAGACSQTPQQAAAPSPDTWASVDGRSITKADVDKAYAGAVQPGAPTPSAEEVLGAKLNLLDELINQDILLERARAEKLEATDAEVETAFAERKGSTTDEQFQLQITQRGLTVNDVKQSLKRELSIQKLFERDITARVAIADQDITNFYNQNKAQFNLAEAQYRLGQIGITPMKDPQLRNRKGSDAGTPAEAKQKADMLMNQLRTGTDFGELALDYSEDAQSIAQGGDLGFVPASALARVNPQLRDAVMKMEPGSVNMVTVGGSYTILMLIGREPAGQRELSNPTVKQGISDLLRSRKEEVLRAAYISALRNDARVTNHLAKQVVDAQGAVPASAASK
jgi:peptidyl-prolyl cis-trans isomerase SurA